VGPVRGYVGQLSWATRDQVDQLATATATAAGPARRLLDLCCGTGGIALHLAQAYGCSVVGVDYADAAVEFARAEAARRGLTDLVTFIDGDARCLPFVDEEFDDVVCVDSMVIRPNRRKVVSECARVLRPGGVLAFSDEVMIGRTLRDPAILAAVNVYGRLRPETVPTYRRLLETSGLQVRELSDTSGSFAEINERWVASYDRYRSELVGIMGEELFAAGRAFFETLGQQARLGALGQVRIVAERV